MYEHHNLKSQINWAKVVSISSAFSWQAGLASHSADPWLVLLPLVPNSCTASQFPQICTIDVSGLVKSAWHVRHNSETHVVVSYCFEGMLSWQDAQRKKSWWVHLFPTWSSSDTHMFTHVHADILGHLAYHMQMLTYQTCWVAFHHTF